MSEHTDDGRKSARGRQAKKRDEDVLEGDDEGDKKVQTPSRTSAKRRGDDEETRAAEAEDDAEVSAEVEDDAEGSAEAEDDAPSGDDTTNKVESDDDIDPVDAGRQWLVTLFENMNLDLDVEGKKDGENYVFNVSGDDAEALIGRSRQSPRLLKSLQTLLSEHLGKAARGNVVVDLGGFKQKRTSRLESIADQLRDAAKRTGQPVKIAGFNSFERRVVHQHLSDDRSVDTESVEKGIFRKLRVFPT